MKNNLNKNVYNDPKLTANVINFIRATFGSSVEVQWETGTKNKIINKIPGEEKYVKLSEALMSRAIKGKKTTQVIHNHTSGIPLPSTDDIFNVVDYKWINNGIAGDYGYLNIKNSFKNLNDKDLIKFKNKANEFHNKLINTSFKDYSHMKRESKEIRDMINYKYNKENINKIVNKYNEKFKEFGIEFKYIQYILKKR